MDELIPIAAPALVGNEKIYVLDCLESSWISSNGKYVKMFEDAFSAFLGVNCAITCSNGTVALHLALLALGVKQGDEVIVPSLTYVATANAVTYCGAKPIFIDSEVNTWNLNPQLIEGLITSRTRAIIVVHLYGHPADMDSILSIARKHGIFVIEDAAEAHGAEYKGRKVGNFGDISTFSFYGNKLITTGEGGMVCTNDAVLAEKVRIFKGQGQDPEKRFWFLDVGYNYRMTNIQAAIGLAQIEKIDWHINRRREIAALYRQYLSEINDVCFSPEMTWAKSVFWLSSIILKSIDLDRDMVMNQMQTNGVETRPFFYPMHILPMYRRGSNTCKVAESLGRSGINLPSHALLSEKQIARIVQVLKEALGI